MEENISIYIDNICYYSPFLLYLIDATARCKAPSSILFFSPYLATSAMNRNSKKKAKEKKNLKVVF